MLIYLPRQITVSISHADVPNYSKLSTYLFSYRKWYKHLDAIKKSKKPKTPSLLKVLVATFWPEYLQLGVLLVIMDLVVRLIQPQMLGNLLDHFRPNTTVTRSEALWYAGAIVLLNALSALLINQYIMRAFHYGMKVRAACCALIYRKVRNTAQWVVNFRHVCCVCFHKQTKSWVVFLEVNFIPGSAFK